MNKTDEISPFKASVSEVLDYFKELMKTCDTMDEVRIKMNSSGLIAFPLEGKDFEGFALACLEVLEMTGDGIGVSIH